LQGSYILVYIDYMSLVLMTQLGLCTGVSCSRSRQLCQATWQRSNRIVLPWKLG